MRDVHVIDVVCCAKVGKSLNYSDIGSASTVHRPRTRAMAERDVACKWKQLPETLTSRRTCRQSNLIKDVLLVLSTRPHKTLINFHYSTCFTSNETLEVSLHLAGLPAPFCRFPPLRTPYQRDKNSLQPEKNFTNPSKVETSEGKFA